jgi:hypothetical protein
MKWVSRTTWLSASTFKTVGFRPEKTPHRRNRRRIPAQRGRSEPWYARRQARGAAASSTAHTRVPFSTHCRADSHLQPSIYCTTVATVRTITRSSTQVVLRRCVHHGGESRGAVITSHRAASAVYRIPYHTAAAWPARRHAGRGGSTTSLPARGGADERPSGSSPAADRRTAGAATAAAGSNLRLAVGTRRWAVRRAHSSSCATPAGFCAARAAVRRATGRSV